MSPIEIEVVIVSGEIYDFKLTNSNPSYIFTSIKQKSKSLKKKTEIFNNLSILFGRTLSYEFYYTTNTVFAFNNIFFIQLHLLYN